MSSDLLLEVKTVEESQDSAGYFPLQNGRYEIKPGMMPLDTDFSNQSDSKLFQLDSNFNSYRQVKLAARKSSLSKYYQIYNYNDSVAQAVAQLIINRLTIEYPQYFHLVNDGNQLILNCQLTKEILYFNQNFELLKYKLLDKSIFPDYISSLDALAAQVQSDILVISRNQNSDNWMSAIHLCYPNHFSAAEKIGQDFVNVHLPVAGMEKINQRAKAIVNTMIVRKPTVRFAWGLSTDTRLNHHPQPPSEIKSKQWYGRDFDINNPKLFLRIERQVMWGLPESNAAMFTIRTYFRDCREIKKDTLLKHKLISAIESMTPKSLIYKGLVESKQDILAWLNQ
ncbi:MAG: DUF3445 domain-containing protein [Rivularia sp. (in: Bacteria)]|nr:DUF3445 domain-containing protein [Rivularia sp. MS3]